MLYNAENIALQSLQILYTFVLRAVIPITFGPYSRRKLYSPPKPDWVEDFARTPCLVMAYRTNPIPPVRKLKAFGWALTNLYVTNPFVKLSDVEETTGHSVRPKWNWGLLFVWPEWIGVRPNCNFVVNQNVP